MTTQETIPIASPLAIEYVNGIPASVRNAGTASSISCQSSVFRPRQEAGEGERRERFRHVARRDATKHKQRRSVEVQRLGTVTLCLGAAAIVCPECGYGADREHIAEPQVSSSE